MIILANIFSVNDAQTLNLLKKKFSPAQTVLAFIKQISSQRLVEKIQQTDHPPQEKDQISSLQNFRLGNKYNISIYENLFLLLGNLTHLNPETRTVLVIDNNFDSLQRILNNVHKRSESFNRMDSFWDESTENFYAGA